MKKERCTYLFLVSNRIGLLDSYVVFFLLSHTVIGLALAVCVIDFTSYIIQLT